MRTRIDERVAFPWSIKEPLLKETGGKCTHCGTLLDRYTNLTVDHVIPLGKGGTNDPENLTVLCEDCNTLKSDMILPPMNWYGYLSVARRKALEEQMRKYMKETDYLAEDCLMPMDTFRIEVPLLIEKRNKHIRMPIYIHGTRMNMDDAFSWLMEYKRTLQWRDVNGVLSHPSEFVAPCYLLKKGDIEVAMVNPWMIHEWGDDIKNYRNEIFIDWFFAPGLPQKDYIPGMLANMVYGVESYIIKNITRTMEGACIVLFHNRCFMSDRFCKSVFDRLNQGRNDEIIEIDTKHSLTTRIRKLTVFHIMGEQNACKELNEKLDKENPDRYTSMEDAMKENKDLNKRLNGSKTDSK